MTETPETYYIIAKEESDATLGETERSDIYQDRYATWKFLLKEKDKSAIEKSREKIQNLNAHKANELVIGTAQYVNEIYSDFRVIEEE
ncbi:hypothetical protein KGV55_03700 [Candidatus Gracilibacteria bacterium]|nr:hypothetical protein [Candidatus Gracilibacteria bacterium]